MPRPPKRAHWAWCLMLLSMPAAAHLGASGPGADRPRAAPGRAAVLLADASRAGMRIGLRLVAAEPAPQALPRPAELDFPASPNAVLCDGTGGYRECRTPFPGPVRLSREVGSARCVEDATWGWREGAVWVDRGCGAVFQRSDG
ncbi:DUF3011 domain-containing protein [Vulcaniibacterium tengchongense]|uniref:DUF3011 family protein n=1 Tax=Vulcaniibacterium tengchongense TaxID=1273429 RepID=A0A3N4VR15_9GAMM|nr:DUF3011 domain-containing protein [Vulcaniibacterium tengchongense]RPE79487.1 DUF3011 family protein [Vulcaniibacterium tengchongense]